MKKNVTTLLGKWSESGNREALDELLPIVYEELHRLAIHRLQNENGNHTLQPTELTHEAYLQLIKQNPYGFKNRTQFFALAAKLMRNILVDHAKAKHAAKRGGNLRKVSIGKTLVSVKGMDLDILALDTALQALALRDELKCRVVELKFFGGLTTSEIAEVVNRSTATVEREWAFSRAWLHNEVYNGSANEG